MGPTAQAGTVHGFMVLGRASKHGAHVRLLTSMSSSMLTPITATLPWYRLAISDRCGTVWRQGPHHVAKNSRTHGPLGARRAAAAQRRLLCCHMRLLRHA